MPLNIRETFPLTHGHAVTVLAEADWNHLERQHMLECSFEELTASMGGALKTYWFLNEKTFPLPRYYYAAHSLGHPDDMVRLILKNFLAKMRGKGFDLVEQVRLLRKFWTDQGLDPRTMERLP